MSSPPPTSPAPEQPAPRPLDPWQQAAELFAAPELRLGLGLALSVLCLWALSQDLILATVRGLFLSLAALLLVGTVLLSALRRGELIGLARGLVGLGLLLGMGGAALSGHDQGVLRLGGLEPAEAYTLQTHDRLLNVHLGGQLRVRAHENWLAFDLGVGELSLAQGSLALGQPAEAALGPWGLSYIGQERAGEPTHARLRVRPKAGGEATEHRMAVGQQQRLPNGSTLHLVRLNGDFGRTLGPAAQILIASGTETAAPVGALEGMMRWTFAQAPDLEARLSPDPYLVELLAVEAPTQAILAVRRRGTMTVFYAGLAFLVAGLGLGLGLAFGRGVVA